MTSSGRLILVEGWSDRIEVRPDDLVVAVTAESLQDLRDRRIAHITPEQFGFVERLAAAEKRLWPAQLEWLERLGDLVALGAPGQQVEARHFPWVYGWPLKALIDRLIVANEECESILSAAGPSVRSVHLYEDPSLGEAEAEVFDGWPDGARARRVVWQQLSRERGIELKVDHGESQHAPRRSTLRNVARSILGLIRPRRRTPEPARSGTRFLFLHGGADVESSTEQLTRLGCVCVSPEETGDTITVAGVSKDIHALSWTRDAALWQELISRATTFLPGRIIESLDRGLAAWLDIRVPRYLSRTATSRFLLIEAGIGAVVTGHVTSEIAAAFIGAAAALPDVESVLIAHGDSPEVAPVWDLHELKTVKHYFVPNKEFADYFRERRAALKSNAAAVHEGSNRWAQYRSWRKPPRPWLNRWDYSTPRPRWRSPLLLGRKHVVVYVSSWVPGELRYLGKPDYTENVTHDIQVAVCDALSSQSDVAVVLKLYPWHRRNSAIERHLRNVRSRVRVSRAPMRFWFPRADAVILDHPSTSLYQAAMAGVPTLALLYSGFQFRPAALAELTGQTAAFSQPAEAAEIVTKFVRSMPAAASEGRPALAGRDLVSQLVELAR